MFIVCIQTLVSENNTPDRVHLLQPNIMNINHKLVLKGTAKISLHERFTQLSKFQVTEDNHHDYDRGHDRGGQSLGGGGVSRYGRGASASYPRDLSPQIQRQARPSSLPFNMDRERLWRPSAAVTAAAKLKRKSIQQRLGVKARLTMPRYRPGAGLGHRLGQARWGSTDSINSNNMGSRLVLDISLFGNYTIFMQKVDWVPKKKRRISEQRVWKVGWLQEQEQMGSGKTWSRSRRRRKMEARRTETGTSSFQGTVGPGD